MEKVVQVKDLKKSFVSRKKKFFKTVEKKELKAVDGVSFDIYKGEIFGLLGPNGAGKTTTIKMITGLLVPSSGTVTLDGIDVVQKPKEALKRIGVVLAGDRGVYWKLTGRENLEYFAAMYGYGPRAAKVRTQEIIDELKIEEFADILVEKYSTGMKQKIALGKALIPNSKVVLLDEPTLGLDPQSAINLRETIVKLKEEGKTILLTTHYMEEADFLCDRIAIVDGGKIIALDTSENLKKQIDKVKSIEFQVSLYNDEIESRIKAIEKIEKVVYEYAEDSGIYKVKVFHNNGDDIIQEILDILKSFGAKLSLVNVKEPSLEDVFIHLTGKNLRA